MNDDGNEGTIRIFFQVKIMTRLIIEGEVRNAEPFFTRASLEFKVEVKNLKIVGVNNFVENKSN